MQKTIYADEYRVLLDWLRNQRKNSGLTMRQLGKMLNVHHSWIGRIEKGERRLDIMEFARICEKMGCNPAEGLRLIAPHAREEESALKVAETRPKYNASRPKAANQKPI